MAATRLLFALLMVTGSAFALWYFLSHRSFVRVGSISAVRDYPAVSREEVVALARSYADHRWEATTANVRHGLDMAGVVIDTPDAANSTVKAGYWHVGAENVGLPYKWGGFDSLQSFDAGLKSGKAAGDIYSAAKRLRGDASVSNEAVGIDCSGFISRCWKLPQKYGTATLPGLCEELRSVEELLPGDILDSPHGHVVLFVWWADAASKSRGVFYEVEAEPEQRVKMSEYGVRWLLSCGARPFRYLRIRD